VLILADEPILKRPSRWLSWNWRCEGMRDRQATLREGEEIFRALLARLCGYACERDGAVTHGADVVLPNQTGSRPGAIGSIRAGLRAAKRLYACTAGDHLRRTHQSTGTVVSLGFNWAQIDIGYRDHWLSPLTDSSTLIGTEAPTMPR